jgi:uncharacterized protein
MTMRSERRRLARLSVTLAAIVMIAVPMQGAWAQDTREVQVSNASAIRTSFDTWANGTGSPYDLLADDVEWTIVGHSVVSRVYTSREDFISNVIRPFGARMATPFVPTINKLYTDGDSVIIYFDAAGTAKDGKPYTNTYAWFLKFAGGKIVKATAFFDSIAFNDFWSRVSPQ